MPVFVLTHEERDSLVKEGGTTFTFVTDGIESALEQAKAAAGDKNFNIAGDADTVQQFIRAGLLDELEIHLAPLLFGEGMRLFDKIGPQHNVTKCVTRVVLPSREARTSEDSST